MDTQPNEVGNDIEKNRPKKYFKECLNAKNSQEIIKNMEI